MKYNDECHSWQKGQICDTNGSEDQTPDTLLFVGIQTYNYNNNASKTHTIIILKILKEKIRENKHMNNT